MGRAPRKQLATKAVRYPYRPFVAWREEDAKSDSEAIGGKSIEEQLQAIQESPIEEDEAAKSAPESKSNGRAAASQGDEEAEATFAPYSSMERKEPSVVATQEGGGGASSAAPAMSPVFAASEAQSLSPPAPALPTSPGSRSKGSNASKSGKSKSKSDSVPVAAAPDPAVLPLSDLRIGASQKRQEKMMDDEDAEMGTGEAADGGEKQSDTRGTDAEMKSAEEEEGDEEEKKAASRDIRSKRKGKGAAAKKKAVPGAGTSKGGRKQNGPGAVSEDGGENAKLASAGVPSSPSPRRSERISLSQGGYRTESSDGESRVVSRTEEKKDAEEEAESDAETEKTAASRKTKGAIRSKRASTKKKKKQQKNGKEENGEEEEGKESREKQEKEAQDKDEFSFPIPPLRRGKCRPRSAPTGTKKKQGHENSRAKKAAANAHDSEEEQKQKAEHSSEEEEEKHSKSAAGRATRSRAAKAATADDIAMNDAAQEAESISAKQTTEREVEAEVEKKKAATKGPSRSKHKGKEAKAKADDSDEADAETALASPTFAASPAADTAEEEKKETATDEKDELREEAAAEQIVIAATPEDAGVISANSAPVPPPLADYESAEEKEDIPISQKEVRKSSKRKKLTAEQQQKYEAEKARKEKEKEVAEEKKRIEKEREEALDPYTDDDDKPHTDGEDADAEASESGLAAQMRGVGSQKSTTAGRSQLPSPPAKPMIDFSPPLNDAAEAEEHAEEEKKADVLAAEAIGRELTVPELKEQEKKDEEMKEPPISAEEGKQRQKKKKKPASLLRVSKKKNKKKEEAEEDGDAETDAEETAGMVEDEKEEEEGKSAVSKRSSGARISRRQRVVSEQRGSKVTFAFVDGKDAVAEEDVDMQEAIAAEDEGDDADRLDRDRMEEDDGEEHISFSPPPLSFFGILTSPAPGGRTPRRTVAGGGSRKKKGAAKPAGRKRSLAGSRPVSASKLARIDPDLDAIFAESGGGEFGAESTEDEDETEEATMTDEELDIQGGGDRLLAVYQKRRKQVRRGAEQLAKQSREAVKRCAAGIATAINGGHQDGPGLRECIKLIKDMQASTQAAITEQERLLKDQEKLAKGIKALADMPVRIAKKAEAAFKPPLKDLQSIMLHFMSRTAEYGAELVYQNTGETVKRT